jgi:hypothetical protein
LETLNSNATPQGLKPQFIRFETARLKPRPFKA